MAETNSNRTLSRFTEEAPPPDDSPLPDDYLQVELVSLENSLSNLHSRIPNLENSIHYAKMNCYYPKESKLTRDESAAIYIYTMEWPVNKDSLYVQFNAALRSKNSSKMEIWLHYLKLLMKALDKIESIQIRVHRGIKDNLDHLYMRKGKSFVWGSLTSCSRNVKTATDFSKNKTGEGSVFTIDTIHGKDIALFSCLKNEAEVVLCPGTRFGLTKPLTIVRFENSYYQTIGITEIS